MHAEYVLHNVRYRKRPVQFYVNLWLFILFVVSGSELTLNKQRIRVDIHRLSYMALHNSRYVFLSQGFYFSSLRS